MPGFSTSLANDVANSTLRGTAFPTYNNLKFALFTADPTDAFTAGTEVAAGWYARIDAGAFAAPTNGVTFNSARREFAPVTGAPITVTHIGVVGDRNGTPTLMYSEALPAPRLMNINDVYVVDSTTLSGDFTLNFL